MWFSRLYLQRAGHWARNALLRHFGRHQRRPRRRRRALLPQHVDGLGCVGHRPSCHLLGMVSSVSGLISAQKLFAKCLLFNYDELGELEVRIVVEPQF